MPDYAASLNAALSSDSRASSHDEAALFRALAPYIGELRQLVTPIAQQAVNPKGVAAVARAFAQRISTSEASHPSGEREANLLRIFVRQTEQLSTRIELNFPQRGGALNAHPEIHLHPDLAAMCKMETLAMHELVERQPSAFILKEVPTTA